MRAEGYFVDRAKRYAEGVCKGRIRASKLTILSCQRFLKDLDREKEEECPFYFSVARAEHACSFIEFLPHIKGKLASAGKLLELEPWQCFILCNIFGWLKKKSNTRRFRKVYIEIPRKNGKTMLGSGISLYCGIADYEEGAEVYMAASTHSQALICFNEARAMVSKDQELCRHFGVEYNSQAIFIPTTNTKIKALPKDNHGTLDGLNVHCGIVDELHAHQTPATWNALVTGTGAREQPLIVAITTAGFNRAAICYEQRTYTKKLLEGVFEDDSYFGIIYTIDEGDDWTDPEVWEKANPNLGISINKENFAAECLEAQNQVTKQNFFLTKHLNVWVGANTAWMDMQKWDKCADPELKEKDLKNLECFVAVDLASAKDFCAVAKVYRERKNDEKGEEQTYYYVFVEHFINEAAIELTKVEEVKVWAQQDLINVNDGEETDQRRVQEYVEQLSELIKPKMIGFDRYQAVMMMQNLQEKRIRNVYTCSQQLQAMSAPMKEMEAAILSGRLKHNGDPVLTWMMSNVIAKMDSYDNIKPNRDKNAPQQKIDGVVATIMAIGMSMTQKPKPKLKMFAI